MTRKLLGRGFLSLLVTQFLGAVNDNVLKQVLIFMVIQDGLWDGRLGSGGQGIVAACLTVPFLLLSGFAGEVADRNNKQRVSLWVKLAEVPIALIAMLGFLTENLWITLAALIALATQSTFFGPAKYGMIPELVDRRDLSRANGIINMMTNIAVIAGTLLAGIVAEQYHHSPAGTPAPVAQRDLAAAMAEDVPVASAELPQAPAETTPSGRAWVPGAVLLLIAGLGVVSVLFMPPLQPGDPGVRYHFQPVTPYVQAFRELKGSALLFVMLAWGYFYLLAGLALLILPEYLVVLSAYNVSRTEVSLLLGVLGIAIGVGCMLAGFLSGSSIRPGMVPVGAVGLSVCFALLGLLPATLPDRGEYVRILLSSHCALILGAGIFAGFYIVPLQALLQRLAPDVERGRFLGVANGLSFAFLTLASLIYYGIRPWFGVVVGQQHPEKIFLICCVLMIVGGAAFLLLFRKSGMTLDRVD